jgi:hypothetical protein
MIWHLKHLAGYALTENQILEHYDPTDEAYTRGHAENTISTMSILPSTKKR